MLHCHAPGAEILCPSGALLPLMKAFLSPPPILKKYLILIKNTGHAFEGLSFIYQYNKYYT